MKVRQLTIGTLLIVIFSIAVPSLAKQIQNLQPLNGIKLDKIQYLESEIEPDPKIERAILQNLHDYSPNNSDEFVRYYYNKVDLNDDAKPEVLVYLVGSYVCGSGGCNALILKPVGTNYELISSIALVNNPIIVSNQKTHEWHDLIMYVAGGGIKPYYALLQFDGRKYPENPSIEPVVKPKSTIVGKALIADDIVLSRGIVLRATKTR